MHYTHTSFYLLIVSSMAISHHVAPRFLNAEVHNRIDALSQSHDLHQQNTSWLRNVVFGSSLTLSVLFLVLLIGFIIICFRLRQHPHHYRLSDLVTPSSYFNPNFSHLLANSHVNPSFSPCHVPTSNQASAQPISTSSMIIPSHLPSLLSAAVHNPAMLKF